MELNLQPPEKKPYWWRPPDSELRRKAVQILLMRTAGIEDEEIAKALGVGKRTVSDYVYKAGRNGWLEHLLDDPKEALEYSVLHKVVRNIDQFLDSPEEKTKKEVTLKVAEGTLFRRFVEAPKEETSNLNVLQIQVVMPLGGPGEIREGTTGGVPAYIEGDVVKES